ncbi:C4-dicarboxylate ABC transporter substrate-binding protein, partial [Vibrio sp. 10N.222.55.C6]
ENTENKIREELQAKGMVFTDPADNEQEWINKVTKSVWPKFYSSIGGKDKLDDVLELLGRK